MPRPGRGYSWPPFEKGNQLPVTHGAYAPRKVDPLAQSIIEEALVAEVAYLKDPSYAPAVWAWARAEASVQLLSEYIAEHGPLDGRGRPRAALDALRRFEGLAAQHRERLGLDPFSRVKLGRTLPHRPSISLDCAMQEEDAGAEDDR
jgi:hypothetical protein